MKKDERRRIITFILNLPYLRSLTMLRQTRRLEQQRQVKCIAKYLAEGAYFVFVSTEGKQLIK
ncbi:MAG TPA: hypothetical protein PLO52_11900 [Flavobacterium alvei]|nr:hypothetical protein [Flavobacterium alvei]